MPTRSTELNSAETSHGVAARRRTHELPRPGRCAVGVLACLLLGALVACREAPKPTLGDTKQLPVWSLAPRPTVSVAPAVQGASSGLVGAVRTANGIAVAELGDQQIRFYDVHGRLLKTGLTALEEKQRGLLWAGRCPGTDLIATQDFRLRRFTFFSDAGGVLKSVSIPVALRYAQLVACPGDGSLLLFHTLPGELTEPGPIASRAQLVRLHASGRSEVLREFSETEFFNSTRDKIFVEQPLGKEALAAAAGDRLFIGNSQEPLVEVVTPGGTTAARIDTRLPRRPAVASDLLKAIALRVYREPSPKTREVVRRALVQTPLRPAQLVYDVILADRERNVWLRTSESARADSARWRVFDKGGRAVAYCDLPADLFLAEVGSDYVVAIRRGPREPEQAVAYRLLKAQVAGDSRARP